MIIDVCGIGPRLDHEVSEERPQPNLSFGTQESNLGPVIGLSTSLKMMVFAPYLLACPRVVLMALACYCYMVLIAIISNWTSESPPTLD